jgi:hypothetical protein
MNNARRESERKKEKYTNERERESYTRVESHTEKKDVKIGQPIPLNIAISLWYTLLYRKISQPQW